MADFDPAKTISESLDKTGEGLGYSSLTNKKLGKQTVEGIQTALNKFLDKEKIDTKLVVDGGYGELTVKAVIKFQQAYKDKYELNAHGAIDRKTLRALIEEGFLEGFEKKSAAISPPPTGPNRKPELETPPELKVATQKIEDLKPPLVVQQSMQQAMQDALKTAPPPSVNRQSPEFIALMQVTIKNPEKINQAPGQDSGFRVTYPGTDQVIRVENPKDSQRGYIKDVRTAEFKPIDGGFQSTIQTVNEKGVVLDTIQLKFNTEPKLISATTLQEDGERLSTPRVSKYVTTSSGLVILEPTATKYEVRNGSTELGKTAKFGVRLSVARDETYEIPFGNPQKDNIYDFGPIADVKISPLTKATTGEYYKMEYSSVDANNRTIDRGLYIFDKDYKLVGSIGLQNDGDPKRSTTIAGYHGLDETYVNQKVDKSKATILDTKSELYSKLDRTAQEKFKAILDQGVKIEMFQEKEGEHDKLVIVYSKGDQVLMAGYAQPAKLTAAELSSAQFISTLGENEIIRRTADYDQKQKILNSILS